MSIEMQIDPRFWDRDGSYVEISVSGDTVHGCLKELVDQEPILREKLFDNEGNLKPAVLIFQNDKPVFPYNLATPVAEGDEVKVIFGGGT